MFYQKALGACLLENIRCPYKNKNYGNMDGYSAAIFALILINAYYVGYNDGANAIATATASRAIKPGTALFLASAIKLIVPIAFYLLGYSAVAGTVGSGIMSMDAVAAASPEKGFIFVLTALVSAQFWVWITALAKLPNATTYTLMGGILGSGIAAFGFSSVAWTSVLLKIVLMCFLTPVVGFLLGFLTLKASNALLKNKKAASCDKALIQLQRFNMVFLAGAFALNNVQKSMGVYMLAMTAGMFSGSVFSPNGNMPVWAVVAFAAAMTLGVLTGGFALINTIGRKIFKIRHDHSHASLLTTNFIMVLATVFGIPLAAGQAVSSSIMGVGAAEKFHRVKWLTAGRIVAGWWLTLPVVAVFGAAIYLFIAKVILGGRI